MTWRYWLGMAVAVVIAVGGLAYIGARKNARDAEGPGSPLGATLARVDGSGAPVLILVDEISHGRASYESRLVSVDVRTGEKVAMRRVSRRGVRCATDSRMNAWCDLGGATSAGIHARTLDDQSHAGAAPEMPSSVLPPACKPITVGGDRIEPTSTGVVRTGATSWQSKLQGSCQLLAVVDDVLVIVLDDRHTRAVALDATTAAYRWAVVF